MSETLKTQVGGDHYKKYAIQPLEFAEKVGLNPMIYSAFKYVCRYKDKNQPLEDLKKAIHCIDIFMECGQTKPVSVTLKDLVAFMSQFDKFQAKALALMLKLQANKDNGCACEVKNTIYYLIGDTVANAE